MPDVPNRSLFSRSRSGDDDARATLIKTHLGIVHFVARRMAKGLADQADLDELVSAGMLGLMAAIDRFDESRGLAFVTFAATRVRGAILDDLRRQDRFPRTLRAKARRIRATRDRLATRFACAPSHADVALALGVDLPTLWRWDMDVERAAELPLDAPAPRTGSEGASIVERLAAPQDDCDHSIDQERMARVLHLALWRLSTIERQVLTLYFFEEQTLSQIGLGLSVSESRVSQLRTQALAHLRSALSEQGVSAELLVA